MQKESRYVAVTGFVFMHTHTNTHPTHTHTLYFTHMNTNAHTHTHVRAITEHDGLVLDMETPDMETQEYTHTHTVLYAHEYKCTQTWKRRNRTTRRFTSAALQSHLLLSLIGARPCWPSVSLRILTTAEEDQDKKVLKPTTAIH